MPRDVIKLFGLRIMTEKVWMRELSGVVDMVLDIGKVIGRAEAYEQLGVPMPTDNYSLRGPLRLFPADPADEDTAA